MKKYLLNLAGIAAIATLAACGGSTAPEAETGEAQQVAEATESAATYTANVAESSLGWYGSKVTGFHEGTVGIAEGVLNVENKAITSGSFTIDLASLKDTDLQGEDAAKLEGHLKSADFFDVEKYPTAKFEIVSVAPFAAGSAEAVDTEFLGGEPTHTITGNLTLKDSTKSVTFPARVDMTEQGVSAKAKFKIDRTKWGVVYNSDESLGDKLIYKDIELRLNLVAGKQA